MIIISDVIYLVKWTVIRICTVVWVANSFWVSIAEGDLIIHASEYASMGNTPILFTIMACITDLP